MAKMLVVNQERCLACKSCVLECALAHSNAGTLIEALKQDSLPQARVHVEPIGEFGMPLQCRQCEDAPCVTVCPTGATYRHAVGDPVLLDADKCIGCKFCIVACPFGAIDLSRDGKAIVKCDLCIARTAVGEQPACVAACHTGALKFEDVDHFLKVRRQHTAAHVAAAQSDPEEQSKT